jgi:hypothetical protein
MKRNRKSKRSGTVLVLIALLIVPLLAMVAFAVDYGYLLKVRTDLQRAADATALAAVQDLISASDGTQDLATVRATVREYAAMNVGASFQVLDSDIEIGRYDPATIYSNPTLLNTGVYDTIRLTLRRDSQANSPVSLFFAKVLGIYDSDITATATAVLQKVTTLRPGNDILPFSVPLDMWNGQSEIDQWKIYGDGKLEDGDGNVVPGNWGTVDIGDTNNSTDDLVDQINDGLRQEDLDDLDNDGRIPSSTHIDCDQPLNLNGDPGLSVGIKSAVRAAHGKKRIIPIYDTIDTSVGLEFHVVRWGVITVIDSHWIGENNTHVKVEKDNFYSGELRPQTDLSNVVNVIEGAYTSPVLVE